MTKNILKNLPLFSEVVRVGTVKFFKFRNSKTVITYEHA